MKLVRSLMIDEVNLKHVFLYHISTRVEKL